MERKERIANIALLFTAMIWGGGFVAGKMALTGSNPFAVLTWRFGIAAVLCFIIFFKRIIKTDKSTIIKACGIGLIQIASLSLQLVGLQYTTPAKQSFLCTAYVALVPFLSWLIIGKKPGIKAIIAGVIALIGIGLISLNGFAGIGLGDGLSLGFSLGFGIQIVLIGKFVSNEVDGLALTFFQMLTCGLVSLVVCLATGNSLIITGNEALIGVAYLAVGNTLLAFIIQNVAQKYTKDSTAALLMSFESVFGFLFSVLYYHEGISTRFILGSGLCFLAILLNSYKQDKEIKKEKQE